VPPCLNGIAAYESNRYISQTFKHALKMKLFRNHRPVLYINLFSARLLHSGLCGMLQEPVTYGSESGQVQQYFWQV